MAASKTSKKKRKPSKQAGAEAGRGRTAPSARRVAELERELSVTRQYLRLVQEQHEMSREEVQASNEEMTTANEELQSTNEQLQTAQEELASSNEELTQLNEEMAHRNTELSRSNTDLTEMSKQLEAFVYSIAHDLRAPLRAMDGLTAVLVEEAGPALSESGRDVAGRIRRAAQFMDALLLDLLAFSALSQQRVNLDSVNLESVVLGVVSRYERQIEERKASVEVCGPWPAVLAHESTLVQVLSNLLGNALKFIAAGREPWVRLRTEEGEAFVRVWVEDNGIGIAPDAQRDIFGIFTRLHGQKYPGTGIGLAIVQKGVEQMGGRVGLESTAGKGSRFWLELRKG